MLSRYRSRKNFISVLKLLKTRNFKALMDSGLTGLTSTELLTKMVTFNYALPNF